MSLFNFFKYILKVARASYLLLFVCLLHSMHAFYDLEDNVQDFVLETRQIIIPEYPHAFNPSIVRWKGRLLMSFRYIPSSADLCNFSSASESYIGLVWLDKEFNPIGSPSLLSLNTTNCPTSRCEDARLLVINDVLYVIYSDNKQLVVTESGFRMYVAQLSFDGNSFHIIQNECLSQFEGAKAWKREKNWIPFDYYGNLMFAYQVNPHKIFFPILGSGGHCETFANSYPSIVWEWGELRGGTPALAIDSQQYLAFFHSSVEMQSLYSQGETTLHYFMGAYTFSTDSPFEITQISPEPIIGKNFYQGAHYPYRWNPVQVVFPGGFIFDKRFIWVAYGRQDHEIWIVKLNKKELLSSLIPVSTLYE